MKVGNKSIDGSWDNTFEQDCGCSYFPCEHYIQSRTGQWAKLIPIKIKLKNQETPR